MKHTEDFKAHLERLGYGKGSVKVLPFCVKDFLQHCGKHPNDIQPADIERYCAYLSQRPNRRRAGGLSDRYIAQHGYALRTFFAWLLESGSLKSDPSSAVQFPKPDCQRMEVLAQSEVNMLYESCGNARERAILSIFYGCGLRRSEGEMLNLADIRLQSGFLFVREGKGKKRRAVPMGAKVAEDLREYMLNGRKPRVGETAFLTNRLGRRLKGNRCNEIVKGLAERAGIEREISLHCLRHSIATHLLEGGLSVEYVRDFLGHKHLEATQIYTRVSQRQLQRLWA